MEAVAGLGRGGPHIRRSTDPSLSQLKHQPTVGLELVETAPTDLNSSTPSSRILNSFLIRMQSIVNLLNPPASTYEPLDEQGKLRKTSLSGRAFIVTGP